METYLKSALRYSYNWSGYEENDPRISGLPDATPFNRHEGEEVLYLIHCLTNHLAYGVENFGDKIERMIHQDLPETITSQAEAIHWIKANWRRVTFKKAGRPMARGGGSFRQNGVTA